VDRVKQRKIHTALVFKGKACKKKLEQSNKRNYTQHFKNRLNYKKGYKCYKKAKYYKKAEY
jgi:ribosomal protein S30